MSSEMIERVARAIAGELGCDPDMRDPDLPDDIDGNKSVWHNYIDVARAAIDAMREPTDAMVNAMDEHAGTIAPQYAYEAAIDAALSEVEDEKRPEEVQSSVRQSRRTQGSIRPR